jgi:hypothetical protein
VSIYLETQSFPWEMSQKPIENYVLEDWLVTWKGIELASSLRPVAGVTS